MIKQEFTYECEIEDLKKAQDLIKEIKEQLQLRSSFDRRVYKDRVLDLLDKMIEKRSNFMLEKEEEVIGKFKELFSMQDATFKELLVKVPGLIDYLHMKFNLNSSCENAIEDLIRMFNRLI